MRRASSRWLSLGVRWGLAVVVLACVVGAATTSHWLPQAQKLIGDRFGASEASPHHDGEAAAAGHDEHEHEAAGAHAEESKGTAAADEHGHEAVEAIVLSSAAQKNIGLRLAKVELTSFERTMSVPGMVVERPGWSVLEVTAPMTGAVTRIYPIQGEAVRPGQPLFEVRLTHEDLLQVQTEFLHTVEELDVVRREVERLEKVTVDGAIAGKTLLERKYEQQKGEASLRSQRQALLLHGLSPQQVDDIVSSRTLLQSLTIRAPGVDGAAPDSAAIPLQVQQLKATQGKHVTAGDTLCTLVDYHELYVEGMAFEQDIQAINGAAAAGQKVSALVGSKSTGDEETVAGLRILYLDDQVERESRTFHFYVSLPNRVVRQDKTTDGRGFVYWQFKPGQRIRILLPVEQWTDRIVLPVEAVAQDGAEAYVFAFDGDDFQRKPVHVEYRDQDSVVIANDGAMELGTTVAVSGAHQIQLAMKNKSGGGVDPHAGHNH
jgi:membrane fusion protein, heavy metal efflux system